MSEQRMVDVGLLEQIADDLKLLASIQQARIGNIWMRNHYEERWFALRDIINGPGVEPVVTDEMVRAYLGANRAYWFEHDKLEPPIGKWCAGTAEEATRVSLLAALRLYLAAPSAPVAKCAECGKQAGEGWALYCVDCAGKVAPVQAVPDGWQLVPKHATHEMCEAVHFGPNCAEEKMQASDREFWEACYSAMLAAAPQPPKESTAQSVACPTDKEK